MSVGTLPSGVLPDLSAVFGFPLGNLPDAGLAEGLRRLGRLSSRVEARRAEYIAEADRRGVARREGYASTTAWLIALSGDPAAVCRSRLAVATSLQAMPQTRAAFAAGEVSEPRVRLLAEARQLAPEQFTQDESRLVSQAASVPSRRLPQLLGEWRRHTDPAGAEANTVRAFARRALHASASWSGMVHLAGDLDPEGGSVVLAALRSLSEPASLDPQDTRSPQQCRADALVEICRRHLDGGHPNPGGRPHVTLTVGWEALQAGTGLADLEGGPVSVEAVRRLACDASVSAVIVTDGSQPLGVGPSRRVVPPALRRALDLRDRGCTHPGCDIPARWCDAHHLHHWAQGGKTELANLRLLCRRHHRQAHHHQPYPQRR
ncbi:MAG TPA: DUF222 domain-containing protein [Acidimicrobiia bacterium]|nr:DUF222 domain-containing protein [Acidimicrobiia bacterium]